MFDVTSLVPKILLSHYQHSVQQDFNQTVDSLNGLCSTLSWDWLLRTFRYSSERPYRPASGNSEDTESGGEATALVVPKIVEEPVETAVALYINSKEKVTAEHQDMLEEDENENANAKGAGVCDAGCDKDGAAGAQDVETGTGADEQKPGDAGAAAAGGDNETPGNGNGNANGADECDEGCDKDGAAGGEAGTDEVEKESEEKATNTDQEECSERLVYYRLMVPPWLRKHASWNCSYEGTELDLDIKADSSNWENVFRVQVIEPGRFQECEDVTVKMCVGVLLPEKCSYLDSNMFYMISDGTLAIGFQLNDPKSEYAKYGPYQAVEGKVGRNCLQQPNTNLCATASTTSKSNPNQFEIRLKPTCCWGSVFCAVDDGHKILALYSTPLNVNKGLRFEVYRHSNKEQYRINYVELFVYCDSPALKLDSHGCGSDWKRAWVPGWVAD